MYCSATRSVAASLPPPLCSACATRLMPLAVASARLKMAMLSPSAMLMASSRDASEARITCSGGGVVEVSQGLICGMTWWCGAVMGCPLGMPAQ